MINNSTWRCDLKHRKHSLFQTPFSKGECRLWWVCGSVDVCKKSSGGELWWVACGFFESWKHQQWLIGHGRNFCLADWCAARVTWIQVTFVGMVGVRFFTQGDISEVRIGPSGTEGKSETVNENRGCVSFEIFMVFPPFLVGCGPDWVLVMRFTVSLAICLSCSGLPRPQKSWQGSDGFKSCHLNLSCYMDCWHLHHS